MRDITCGLEWNAQKAYLFTGDQFLCLDLGSGQLDPGFPKPVAGNWPGLQAMNLDAAVNWGNGKCYFFSGDRYVRYDVAGGKVDSGYPRPIAGSWPGLWPSGIDAAVNWGNGKAYFFRGDAYIRYDIAADCADPGYPRPIAGNWPGLWPSGIGAAVRAPGGKVLFFKGRDVLRYDVVADHADAGFPRPLVAGSTPVPTGGASTADAAHLRVVEIATAEIGRVIAGQAGPADETGSATRVGWERLMEYFEVACGGPTRFSRDVVKYHRYPRRKEDGPIYLPSWCGIFTVWALKRAGLPVGDWSSKGVSALLRLTSNPQPGDVAYIDQPFQHHCIVACVEGDTIVTINGNSGGVGAILEERKPRTAYTCFYRA